MEYIVKGRIPVGRPRKTWLGNVEADMTELEIDKEDVHDGSADQMFHISNLGNHS